MTAARRRGGDARKAMTAARGRRAQGAVASAATIG